MIKRNSLKWMAIIAVFLSFFPSLWAGSSDSLLVKLNQTIEQRPSYMQRKEEALETLRQSLSKLSAGNVEGRMNLYEALWQENRSYNTTPRSSMLRHSPSWLSRRAMRSRSRMLCSIGLRR